MTHEEAVVDSEPSHTKFGGLQDNPEQQEETVPVAMSKQDPPLLTHVEAVVDSVPDPVQMPVPVYMSGIHVNPEQQMFVVP